MIQKKSFQEQHCDFYFKDQYLFEVDNSLTFYDCLLQIKNENVHGYYIVFNGQKISIDKNGTLEDYPCGLFDTHTNILIQML